MRLDNYLVEINYFDSRTKAKQSIERGEIFIEGKIVSKPSYYIDNNTQPKIERVFIDSFVSLGGFKLNKAINELGISVNNKICIDIGASTGGFTDCLLQHGAKKVYAVDLNDSLLHPSLKNNERVTPIIKNVKNLKKADFDDKIDLIVADLSFISITQAIPIISDLLDNDEQAVLLIKPQFETNLKRNFKNGIIRDKKIQIEACKNAYNVASQEGLFVTGFTTTEINSQKNLEILMSFIKNGVNKISIDEINF